MGHKNFVLSVALSPDDHWAVTGSKDRAVHFWDMRQRATAMVVQGHRNSVISVDVSRGQHPMFASGSGDSRARIWRYKP